MVDTAARIPENQRATANRFSGDESRAQKPEKTQKSQGAQKPGTSDKQKSAGKASPTRHETPLSAGDYVDNVIQSVSMSLGEYVLHWKAGGRQYSRVLPETWIVRGRGRGTVLNSDKIYESRQLAIEALVPLILRIGGGNTFIGFWRNNQWPFTVPTLFTEFSTPRVIAALDAKDADMRQAALEAEAEMKSLATGMIVGRVIAGAYSGAHNPRLYRSFDPKPSVPNVRVSSAEQLNATSVPVRGQSSSTAPPASGSETSTRPPTSGSVSATPAQRGTTPQSKSTKVGPTSGLPPGVLESGGANQRGPSFVSATAQTPRSVITSVRADVAESQAYIEALRRGEIGLQRPAGANVPGDDFITAAVNPSTGRMEVIVTDVKASTTGKFPKPATVIKPTWMAEVHDAVSANRLSLGDSALELRIRQAVANGNVVLRQVDVNYSPTPQGQGSMSGFGPPPAKVVLTPPVFDVGPLK